MRARICLCLYGVPRTPSGEKHELLEDRRVRATVGLR